MVLAHQIDLASRAWDQRSDGLGPQTSHRQIQAERGTGAQTGFAGMAHGLGGLSPEDCLGAQVASQKECQDQQAAQLVVAAREADCVRMTVHHQKLWIHLSLLCTHLFASPA